MSYVEARKLVKKLEAIIVPSRYYDCHWVYLRLNDALSTYVRRNESYALRYESGKNFFVELCEALKHVPVELIYDVVEILGTSDYCHETVTAFKTLVDKLPGGSQLFLTDHLGRRELFTKAVRMKVADAFPLEVVQGGLRKFNMTPNDFAKHTGAFAFEKGGKSIFYYSEQEDEILTRVKYGLGPSNQRIAADG